MATHIPKLRSKLLNESGKVHMAARFQALFSLKLEGATGNCEAVEAIAEGFSDSSELLKHELAYVLGQTGNSHAVPLLEKVLNDKQQPCMVRHEAAEALGALGSKSSVPLLQHFFHDDSSLVIRQTCELALDRIQWESNKPSCEIIQASAYSSTDPAPSLPISELPISIAALTSLLNNQKAHLFERYRAMFALRDLNTPDAIHALTSGFSDPSALFRHEIAYVFGQMASEHSTDALIQVLRNQNEEAMVRHEAAEALGSIGSAACQEILKDFVKDPEQVVRESCEVALDMANWTEEDEQFAVANTTAAVSTA